MGIFKLDELTRFDYLEGISLTIYLFSTSASSIHLFRPGLCTGCSDFADGRVVQISKELFASTH
jgi:hypothetical protein